METLTRDAFALKEELASLGVAVAKARGEVSQMETEKMKLVKEARKTAEKEIETAHKEASKTFDQINAMNDEVENARKEVLTFITEVQAWKKRMESDVDSEISKLNAVTATLKEKVRQSELKTSEIKTAMMQIVAERKANRIERKTLDDYRRQLDSKASILKEVERIKGIQV